MAITARYVMDTAKTQLLDETGVHWPDVELLRYLNDGKREIAKYLPHACTETDVLVLSAGTRQSPPADVMVLVDVVRNMGTTGTDPGRAITPIDKTILDVVLPEWHNVTPKAEVLHYCYDRRNPREFYVFPPQPPTGTGQVEVVFGVLPDDSTVSSLDGTATGQPNSDIFIPDEYANALLTFILHRAHAKETEAGSLAKSAAYLQGFIQAMGAKETGKVATEPQKGP